MAGFNNTPRARIALPYLLAFLLPLGAGSAFAQPEAPPPDVAVDAAEADPAAPESQAEPESDETPAAEEEAVEPVEEAPVEDASVEDASVEDASVEEAPVEEAAVEDAPVEDASVEVAPVEVAPVEEAPVEVAPVEEAEDEPEEEPSEEGVSYALHGEARFRINYMSDLPLMALEEKGVPDSLEQNVWAGTWLRLHGEVSVRPTFRLVGEADFLDGLIFGDETAHVDVAILGRDSQRAIEADGFEPRSLFAEWRSPIGMFRAGLMTSYYGLGILVNDGAHPQPFGDYDYGDRYVRLAFATRPFGRDVPFNIALAGDLVYDDRLAIVQNGDRALQGVLAAFWGDAATNPDRTLGVYVAYRSQRSDVDFGATPDGNQEDELNVVAVDLHAEWDFEEPSGGRIYVGFEGIGIFGTTTLVRDIYTPERDIRQFIWAAQIARRAENLDVTIEVGFASGDSNSEDDVVRRATMDPDHQIGLIMFPEAMAWMSARAANLAQLEDLTARPAPGSQLLPTDGGVSGAYYLFPYGSYRPVDWLDVRLGMVWGRASADVVDPFRQRAESRSVNFQGGDAGKRDLGLELDGAIVATIPLPEDMSIEAGIEGGVFFPGGAFDDENGASMDPMGMVRLKLGFGF